MRRAARVDDNHSAFGDAMRRAGWLMHDTSRLGGGFPDWVGCSPHGFLCAFEVKNPLKPPSQRQLTDDQREWHETWHDRRYAPAWHVLTAEEALSLYQTWVDDL